MIHRIIVNKLKLELLPQTEEEIYNKSETAKWNIPQFDEVIISSSERNGDKIERRMYRVMVTKGIQVGEMKISEEALIDWEHDYLIELVAELAERDFKRLSKHRKVAAYK